MSDNFISRIREIATAAANDPTSPGMDVGNTILSELDLAANRPIKITLAPVPSDEATRWKSAMDSAIRSARRGKR